MILSLDSSTSRGSVALVSAGRVVQHVFVETFRGRGGALFSALQKILGKTDEITRVVVGIGPGSYNGIRSAIAVAWGISAAREIPLVGISSLLGLDEGNYCAVGDARGGQYYFARVSAGKFVAEPELLHRSQLLAAVRDNPSLPLFSPAQIEFLQGISVRTPNAVNLARLAADWEPNCPKPLYLKPPHITAPKRGFDGS